MLGSKPRCWRDVLQGKNLTRRRLTWGEWSPRGDRGCQVGWIGNDAPMPPAPSEDLLRKACAWKAFKQGRELFAAGAVVEAAECEGGWRGAVRDGRKLLRLRVEVRGPGDIEAHCGCPANQASGEICGHAVAVGLALGRPRPMPAAEQTAPTDRSVPCWRVEFMTGWQQAIRRGQLPLRLHPLPQGVAGSFDRWCQGRVDGGRGDDPSPRLIQLRGADLREGLVLLLDKEELFCAECEDGQPLLASGARMVLIDRRTDDGRIEVVPHAGSAGEWIELGGDCWWLNRHGLKRAGESGLPAELMEAWRRWSRGQGVSFPADEWVLNGELWRDWIECSAEGWRSGLHFGCAPIGMGVDFEGGPQRLLARLKVRHGQGRWEPATPDAAPRVLGWADGCCQLADRDAQRAAFVLMTGLGFSPPSASDNALVLEGEGRVSAFLMGKRSHLPADWELGFSAPLQRWLQGRVLVEPVLEAVAAEDDRLEFVLSYRSAGGERVEASEIRRCLRGAKVRLGAREVVASDRINQLFDPLLEELEIAQRDGRYEARGAAAELFLKLCKNQDKQLFNNDLQLAQNRPIPATISANLRPYQVVGYRWICDRLERFGGALLADDMGLGKTLQTIASVEDLLGPNPTSIALVVVPTSLLGNWQREWQRFAPSRPLCVLHGAGRDRLRDQIVPGTVVLTSYATLVRDQAWHLRQDYRVVVADEASLMRNPDTDHARALCKLKATARLALTGTPVENGVRDLWSIFRFIQPGWLGTRGHFEERYGVKAEGGPDAGALERLRCLSSPFMLRRLKGQVAADLPPRIVIDELCALSEEQREVYRDLLREGQELVGRLRDVGQPAAARMQVLTALLRLRQCCVDLALLGIGELTELPIDKRSGKMQRLLGLLEEAVAGGHKVLVFSQFRSQLLRVGEELQRMGLASLRLDGVTRQRQELVERFQSPDGPPVMLISLKAGGYGLNLTAADVVVHLDPWWNPAAEAQASDRAHRIGQNRPVTVYRLVTSGTVEEKVQRMQAGKRAQASWVDEEGEALWSMPELENLLVRD